MGNFYRARCHLTHIISYKTVYEKDTNAPVRLHDETARKYYEPVVIKCWTFFRRKEALKHTDRRVQIMNRLLTGIRTLKMYAWEAIQESMVGVLSII